MMKMMKIVMRINIYCISFDKRDDDDNSDEDNEDKDDALVSDDLVSNNLDLDTQCEINLRLNQVMRLSNMRLFFFISIIIN